MEKFNCDCCSLCCRHIGGNPLAKNMDRGDGVCKFLNTSTNLCTIYYSRPDFCNVEKGYKKYFAEFSEEEYLRLNYEVCNKLKEEFFMKAAILLANGFEEAEALVTIDILRRAGITIDSFSLAEEFVTSSRKITVRADKILGDNNLTEYDMVILPGGQPGSTTLSKDERVLNIVRKFDAEKKFVAAICAAPMVLHAAGVSKGRKLTSFPTDELKSLFADANYIDDELVVQDGNFITSRGAGTTMPFAYKIVDVLGGNSEPVKKGMLYDRLLAGK